MIDVTIMALPLLLRFDAGFCNRNQKCKSRFSLDVSVEMDWCFADWHQTGSKYADFCGAQAVRVARKTMFMSPDSDISFSSHLNLID